VRRRDPAGGHNDRPSPGTYQRTAIGLGVSAVPNFLDLDDEDTVAYDARRTPAVSLPALRAECSGGVRSRSAGGAGARPKHPVGPPQRPLGHLFERR